MALEERETVVVEDRDRNSGSWIIPVVVLLLIILAFFYFGGMNMFGGDTTNENETINIDTPDNVEVTEPTTTPDSGTSEMPESTEPTPTNP